MRCALFGKRFTLLHTLLHATHVSAGDGAVVYAVQALGEFHQPERGLTHTTLAGAVHHGLKHTEVRALPLTGTTELLDPRLKAAWTIDRSPRWPARCITASSKRRCAGRDALLANPS